MDKSGGELIMEKIILAMMLLLNLFFYIFILKNLFYAIYIIHICVYIYGIYLLLLKNWLLPVHHDRQLVICENAAIAVKKNKTSKQKKPT